MEEVFMAGNDGELSYVESNGNIVLEQGCQSFAPLAPVQDESNSQQKLVYASSQRNEENLYIIQPSHSQHSQNVSQHQQQGQIRYSNPPMQQQMQTYQSNLGGDDFSIVHEVIQQPPSHQHVLQNVQQAPQPNVLHIVPNVQQSCIQQALKNPTFQHQQFHLMNQQKSQVQNMPGILRSSGREQQMPYVRQVSMAYQLPQVQTELNHANYRVQSPQNFTPKSQINFKLQNSPQRFPAQSPNNQQFRAQIQQQQQQHPYRVHPPPSYRAQSSQQNFNSQIIQNFSTTSQQFSPLYEAKSISNQPSGNIQLYQPANFNQSVYRAKNVRSQLRQGAPVTFRARGPRPEHTFRARKPKPQNDDFYGSQVIANECGLTIKEKLTQLRNNEELYDQAMKSNVNSDRNLEEVSSQTIEQDDAEINSNNCDVQSQPQIVTVVSTNSKSNTPQGNISAEKEIQLTPKQLGQGGSKTQLVQIDGGSKILQTVDGTKTHIIHNVEKGIVQKGGQKNSYIVISGDGGKSKYIFLQHKDSSIKFSAPNQAQTSSETFLNSDNRASLLSSQSIVTQSTVQSMSTQNQSSLCQPNKAGSSAGQFNVTGTNPEHFNKIRANVNQFNTTGSNTRQLASAVTSSTQFNTITTNTVQFNTTGTSSAIISQAAMNKNQALVNRVAINKKTRPKLPDSQFVQRKATNQMIKESNTEANFPEVIPYAIKRSESISGSIDCSKEVPDSESASTLGTDKPKEKKVLCLECGILSEDVNKVCINCKKELPQTLSCSKLKPVEQVKVVSSSSVVSPVNVAKPNKTIVVTQNNTKEANTFQFAKVTTSGRGVITDKKVAVRGKGSRGRGRGRGKAFEEPGKSSFHLQANTFQFAKVTSGRGVITDKKVAVRGKGSRGRGRGRGRAFEEPEILTLSSDEEDSNSSNSKSVSSTPTNLTDNQPWSTVSQKEKHLSEGDVFDSIAACKVVVKGGSERRSVRLKCRSVRIGSHKVISSDPVTFYHGEGVKLLVPPITGSTDKVEISIDFKNISSILGHFGNTLPVIFFYLRPDLGPPIRNALQMTDRTGSFFDPSSNDESHKRVTVLPDRLDEDARRTLKEMLNVDLVSFLESKNEQRKNLFHEISQAEANEILIRSSPQEVQTQCRLASLRNENNEHLTLVVYPPAPTKGGIAITIGDYCCLEEEQFLNDVIIDFYLKFLLNQVGDVNRERTHVFSTFFYKRLTSKPKRLRRINSPEDDPSLTPAQKRHARVKSWTKNVDLFSKDFIIIPINEHSHWILAVICFAGLEGPLSLEDGKPVPIAKAKTPKGPKKVVKKEEILPPIEDVEWSERDEAEGDDDELEDSDDESNDTLDELPKTSDETGKNCGQSEKNSDALENKNISPSSNPVSKNNKESTESSASSLKNCELIENRELLNADKVSTDDSSNMEISDANDQISKLNRDKTLTREQIKVDSSSKPETDLTEAGSKSKTARTQPGSLTETELKKENKTELVMGNNKKVQNYIDKSVPIKQACILIFDSLAGASRSRIVATLRDYLTIEHQQRKGFKKVFDRDTMPGASPKVPQQMNFSDCGIFTLHFAEKIFKNPLKNFRIPIRGLVNWFDQAEVNRKREEIANIIQNLMKDQKPDGKIEVPELHFNSSENKSPPKSPCSQLIKTIIVKEESAPAISEETDQNKDNCEDIVMENVKSNQNKINISLSNKKKMPIAYNNAVISNNSSALIDCISVNKNTIASSVTTSRSDVTNQTSKSPAISKSIETVINSSICTVSNSSIPNPPVYTISKSNANKPNISSPVKVNVSSYSPRSILTANAATRFKSVERSIPNFGTLSVPSMPTNPIGTIKLFSPNVIAANSGGSNSSKNECGDDDFSIYDDLEPPGSEAAKSVETVDVKVSPKVDRAFNRPIEIKDDGEVLLIFNPQNEKVNFSSNNSQSALGQLQLSRPIPNAQSPVSNSTARSRFNQPNTSFNVRHPSQIRNPGQLQSRVTELNQIGLSSNQLRNPRPRQMRPRGPNQGANNFAPSPHSAFLSLQKPLSGAYKATGSQGQFGAKVSSGSGVLISSEHIAVQTSENPELRLTVHNNSTSSVTANSMAYSSQTSMASTNQSTSVLNAPDLHSPSSDLRPAVKRFKSQDVNSLPIETQTSRSVANCSTYNQQNILTKQMGSVTSTQDVTSSNATNLNVKVALSKPDNLTTSELHFVSKLNPQAKLASPTNFSTHPVEMQNFSHSIARQTNKVVKSRSLKLIHWGQSENQNKRKKIKDEGLKYVQQRIASILPDDLNSKDNSADSTTVPINFANSKSIGNTTFAVEKLDPSQNEVNRKSFDNANDNFRALNKTSSECSRHKSDFIPASSYLDSTSELLAFKLMNERSKPYSKTDKANYFPVSPFTYSTSEAPSQCMPQTKYSSTFVSSNSLNNSELPTQNMSQISTSGSNINETMPQQSKVYLKQNNRSATSVQSLISSTSKVRIPTITAVSNILEPKTKLCVPERRQVTTSLQYSTPRPTFSNPMQQATSLQQPITRPIGFSSPQQLALANSATITSLNTPEEEFQMDFFNSTEQVDQTSELEKAQQNMNHSSNDAKLDSPFKENKDKNLLAMEKIGASVTIKRVKYKKPMKKDLNTPTKAELNIQEDLTEKKLHDVNPQKDLTDSMKAHDINSQKDLPEVKTALKPQKNVMREVKSQELKTQIDLDAVNTLLKQQKDLTPEEEAQKVKHQTGLDEMTTALKPQQELVIEPKKALLKLVKDLSGAKIPEAPHDTEQEIMIDANKKGEKILDVKSEMNTEQDSVVDQATEPNLEEKDDNREVKEELIVRTTSRGRKVTAPKKYLDEVEDYLNSKKSKPSSTPIRKSKRQKQGGRTASKVPKKI